MRDNTKNILKLLAIALAASVEAIFFKMIIEGRGLLATGVSGLAVIVSRLLGNVFSLESSVSIIYMLLYLLFNLPLFILSYKGISKRFMISSFVYVVVYSLVAGLIPSSIGLKLGFDKLDILTSALLMGLVTGFASSCGLYLGGCNGGISIISTYLTIKKGKGIGGYQFLLNGSVILLGYLIFKDLPAIIYTLVYAFSSSLVLDRYYIRNKKILLEIVTDKKEEVCDFLLKNSHHGCTVMEAKGAYTNETKYVIHTAVSWFQLKSINKTIKEIDPESFIINTSIYSVNGNFYLPPIK